MTLFFHFIIYLKSLLLSLFNRATFLPKEGFFYLEYSFKKLPIYFKFDTKALSFEGVAVLYLNALSPPN